MRVSPLQGVVLIVIRLIRNPCANKQHVIHTFFSFYLGTYLFTEKPEKAARAPLAADFGAWPPVGDENAGLAMPDMEKEIFFGLNGVALVNIAALICIGLFINFLFSVLNESQETMARELREKKEMEAKKKEAKKAD